MPVDAQGVTEGHSHMPSTSLRDGRARTEGVGMTGDLTVIKKPVRIKTTKYSLILTGRT